MNKKRSIVRSLVLVNDVTSLCLKIIPMSAKPGSPGLPGRSHLLCVEPGVWIVVICCVSSLEFGSQSAMACQAGAWVTISCSRLGVPGGGTGRLVLRAANFPAENDVYGAVVGAYTLWGLYLALRHMLRLARHSNFQVAFPPPVPSTLTLTWFEKLPPSPPTTPLVVAGV